MPEQSEVTELGVTGLDLSSAVAKQEEALKTVKFNTSSTLFLAVLGALLVVAGIVGSVYLGYTLLTQDLPFLSGKGAASFFSSLALVISGGSVLFNVWQEYKTLSPLSAFERAKSEGLFEKKITVGEIRQAIAHARNRGHSDDPAQLVQQAVTDTFWTYYLCTCCRSTVKYLLISFFCTWVVLANVQALESGILWVIAAVIFYGVNSLISHYNEIRQAEVLAFRRGNFEQPKEEASQSRTAALVMLAMEGCAIFVMLIIAGSLLNKSTQAIQQGKEITSGMSTEDIRANLKEKALTRLQQKCPTCSFTTFTLQTEEPAVLQGTVYVKAVVCATGVAENIPGTTRACETIAVPPSFLPILTI